MPGAIARIGREKRLRTLAQNLFVIEGPNKAANLRRAERALLRQNPWLADPQAFRPGAVVLVPSDIGLATTPRVERPAADLQGLLQASTQRLQMSEKVMREGFAKSDERTKVALTRLEDPTFLRELKKAAPEAAKLVPHAVRSLKQRMDENRKRETEIAHAIQEAISDIDRLRRLAR